MAKVLRLKTHGVRSDGTATNDPFDLEVRHPDTGERILDEQGKPCVVITMRPMPPDEWRAILADHEKIERDDLTGQTVRKVDHEAAVEELVCRCVLNWRGFDGADDRPLQCVDLAKRALDARIKQQVWRAALGAEVVAAVDRASFREPENVAGVVG
jgi:hypothetical protein